MSSNLMDNLSEQLSLCRGGLSAARRVELRALATGDKEHTGEPRALVCEIPPSVALS